MSKASDRLKKMAEEEERVKLEIVKSQKEARGQRLNAVLELKANMEGALDQLKGANERASLAKKKLENEQKEEFQEILGQGKNPYEVFRRRKMENRAKKKISNQKARIKASEMEIAERMLANDAYIRKEEAKEKKIRDYEKKYQSELGRKSKEDRIQKYMIEKTADHTELVDPTGRMFRIEPSQVTTIKDHSFGLGKSATKDRKQRKDVIDMIKSKEVHRDVQPDPRFIPKVITENNESSAALSDLKAGEDPVIIPGESIKSEPTPPKKQGLGVPKRSVMEKRMMARALEKQRENMIEKQVVWGKEFKGTPFISSPATIEFKDFTVGEPMVVKFSLTNVSNTFNHFKVMSLPDKIKDFFEIVYEKPGRMSAGMTCPLYITFNPKVNTDISAEIPCVAKTGEFSIPLRCFSKKLVPAISKDQVVFNNVIRGEGAKTRLKLTNDGALSASFEVLQLNSEGQDIVPVVQRHEKGGGNDDISTDESDVSEMVGRAQTFFEAKKDTNAGCIKFTEKGQLDAYSGTFLTFTYSPLKSEKLACEYKIQFRNSDGEIDEKNSIIVSLNATSVEVPIYVEQELIDFKTCVYDKLYRSKLVLRNRGKVALKCQVEEPPYLKGCIEFLPNFGYVQGSSTKSGVSEHGKFEFQLKFRPNSELLQRHCASEFMIKRELEVSNHVVIAVPIKVTVTGQILPATFCIKAHICNSDIGFSVKDVNFGPCYTNQSVTKEIMLRNHSLLPQKFGFVNLGPQVDIQPNDGFGTLLPLEQKPIQAIFKPTSAVDYNFKLYCRTTMTKKYEIKCQGRGYEPTLRLSENVVRLGATSEHEKVIYSIVVKNETAKEQKAEFVIPKEAEGQILLNPQVLERLSPSDSVRIEVEYRPKLSSTGDNEIVDTEDPSVNKGPESISPEEGKVVESLQHAVPAPSVENVREVPNLPDIDPEPVSQHSEWNIYCFTSPINEDEHPDTAATPPLSLTVHTTLVPEQVKIDSRVLDFGQLALGRSKTLQLRVSNISNDDLQLRMRPLNVSGPFTVVNALRVIPIGNFQTVFLQFQPQSHAIFNETLTLQSVKGLLRVRLKGEGVNPVLAVEPADGKLNMCHVLAGESLMKPFLLKNSSEFPLQYKIKPQTKVPLNFDRTPVISCMPGEGALLPGQEQTVQVTFSPDRENPNEFCTVLKIDVPNQIEDHQMVITGRCWARQAYVVSQDALKGVLNVNPNEPHECVEDAMELPPDFIIPTEEKEYVPTPKARRIYVDFPQELSAENNVKVLVLGSIKLCNEKLSSSATFTVADVTNTSASKYFSIEPSKGSLSAGQETEVSVKFNPPAITTVTDTTLGIGQWEEATFKCTISGGFVPDSIAAKEQEVEIVVRGYVKDN